MSNNELPTSQQYERLRSLGAHDAELTLMVNEGFTAEHVAGLITELVRYPIGTGALRHWRLFGEYPRGARNLMALPIGERDTITAWRLITRAADLVAWGAIGARTTESQVHRELASGLSCPVGFKNGTDGNVRIALDAVKSAGQTHHFLAVTKSGRGAVATTTGNEDCHVILRGGTTPNYDAASVEAACAAAVASGVRPAVMIDASHANSGKNPDNQPLVIDAIAAQLAAGDARIVGAMLESNLVAGRQDLVPGQPLTYGQSITDGCIGWETTVEVLQRLAAATEERRRVRSRRVA